MSKAMRRAHAGPMKSTLYTNKFEDWAVDLQGPYPESLQGNRWHLHLVDLATGWNVSVALPDKKAATVALAIHEHVVLNGPTTCPQKLISDNGSEFVNAIADEMCKQFGIKHLRSTPYHPTGNAFVERPHRTYNSIMRTFLHKYGKEFDETLPYACRALNTHAFDGTTCIAASNKHKYPRTVCARPRACVEPAAASAPPLVLLLVLVLVM